MRALMFDRFGELPTVRDVPDPAPADHGVVVQVAATGLCRSDWHGWQGHDPDIRLPHIPGHELAGTIVAVGRAVRLWRRGDRVTVPFVCGCGTCAQCVSGNHQVCDHQTQPGFTYWGSFAEYVALDHADVNLVRIPESIDAVAAASLGCRFVTAFRALVDQARLAAGEWLCVYGCGGVGLSAIMIARAIGARVVAVDISADRLEFAGMIGAEVGVNAAGAHGDAGASGPPPTIDRDAIARVRDATGGGAHVSIDALGSAGTCWSSVSSLRKRGRHVQIGLMLADDRAALLPMDSVIANELELYGSHGMQAHRYPELLAMIEAGSLDPRRLVGRTITLDEAASALAAMGTFTGTGVTVIDRLG
ncbi:MAG: alcohol dehydrogenase [Spirochaetaceae bacterium]|nr:MAG: alcohol dehydrogenase [Spirochaetaceae bacterium]